MSYLPEKYDNIVYKVVEGSIEDRIYREEITHPDFDVVDKKYILTVSASGTRKLLQIEFEKKYKRRNIFLISKLCEDYNKWPFWDFYFSQQVLLKRNDVQEVYSTDNEHNTPKHEFILIAMALLEREKERLKL